MPRRIEISGQLASPGHFAGPLVRLSSRQTVRSSTGSPAAENAALLNAIAAAKAELEGLIARSAGAAADILEFQVALLDDDNLAEPAFAGIAAGTPADCAWTAALDGHIAEYVGSDDETFRARGADLTDLRDRVLRQLGGNPDAVAIPPGSIVFATDLTPSQFLETDWGRGGGIALAAGSASSHVAMLARARGVPMVIGLGTCDLEGHIEAIVDGGLVILSPSAADRANFVLRAEAAQAETARLHEFLIQPAITADGVLIKVQVNVADPADLAGLESANCDGIGLMRSEFLFRDGQPLPGEDQQFQSYRAFLAWAKGKPVVIRTLDIGGDKPIAGLTEPGESNPFLGRRGVRLTLSRPDVFKTQLRALVRAAQHGNLRIMLPMVAVPDELAATRRLLDEVCHELGTPRPPLGIMIEVPAAALTPERFTKADFFSIGSNDLTQYTMAASRDTASVAALNDPANPAVLKLIETTVAGAAKLGIEVSLCGDMASDPKHLAALFAIGLRSLSVAPAALANVKAAIATIDTRKPAGDFL